MTNNKQQASTTQTRNRRWNICFIASMLIISFFWLIVYQSHPAAPPPLGTHSGIGWWGWFDQNQYLQITKQFISADYFNPQKYYPPLYPAIASITSGLLGITSAYIITDLALCLLFFGTLFYLFKKYLNPLIVLGSVALAYGATSIAYEQWVIPWTTNLSSVLLISISYLASQEYQNRDRQNIGLLNGRASISFAMTGFMIWVRPFEIIPAGILCIGLIAFQLKSRLSKTKESSPSKKISNLLQLLLAPLLSFAIVVLLYAIYNLKTFGSFEPSYSKTINSMGFSPWDIGFKFISLVTNSSAYGLSDGHLSYHLPLFVPLALLSIASLFFLEWPLKFLVLAALTSFTSYLTFNDLVPTGLFTFNNLHYFTWSIAVIGISAISSLKIIIQKSKHQQSFREKQLPLLTGAVVLISIVVLHKSPAPNTVALETSPATILCTSEQVSENVNRSSAVMFQFKKKPNHADERNQKTRLLKLDVQTDSSPTQIHVAHSELIELTLNQKQLFYRKDWRLVNRKGEGGNKLSILLHKPVSSADLSGIITIGLDSNINIPMSQQMAKQCISGS